MARRSETDLEDRVLADALVRRRGCIASLGWPLAIVLLLGGGAAGAYFFRDYDGMRQQFYASQYRERSDRERVEAAERRARDAEGAADHARTQLDQERTMLAHQRDEAMAERDRLRTQLEQMNAAMDGGAGDAAVTDAMSAIAPDAVAAMDTRGRRGHR